MSLTKPNYDESWAFYRRCTDKRHVMHVCYGAVSADVAGPTCWWSYWWHQWAHNNWSETRRYVQLLIVRYGERVSPQISSRCRSQCASAYTTHQYLLTLYYLFEHKLDRVQCVFGSACASSLDELTSSDAENPQVHLFTYLLPIADIVFAFFEKMPALYYNERLSQGTRWSNTRSRVFCTVLWAIQLIYYIFWRLAEHLIDTFRWSKYVLWCNGNFYRVTCKIMQNARRQVYIQS